MRALLAFLLLAASAEAKVWDSHFRMRVGHDPAWSAPAFDDSTWPRVHFHEVPEANDSIWLRIGVDTTAAGREPGHPLGLYVGAMAAHEVWWDGRRIGGSGIVGRSRSEEVPGPIEAHYQIPDDLAAPGRHLLALRVSSFHRGFSPLFGYWAVIVGDYDEIVERRRESAPLALIALSGILFTAVFAFAMFWVARRDRSFLLLGTLCLSAAALLIVEAWRPLFGYDYDWHIVRLRAVVFFSWLTGVQLVALLLTRFPHRLGRPLLAATAIVAAIIPIFPRGWDPKSLLIFMWCVAVALGWSIFATVRRLRGSVPALIGTAVTAAALYVEPWMWIDWMLYFALDFVFICLLLSHAFEVRRERQERARLELEMLRRHMQPHFLMNTLTALTEWIEQEPRTAVRMIESLSEELRILGDMTTRRLVSAADELHLCRVHLSNMSLRRDVDYRLDVEGVNGEQMVPPAIFHTLIENAITHTSSAQSTVVMRLAEERLGSLRRYIFDAPAASEPRSNGGNGTRYIEARLREVWGDRWSLRQGAAGELWRTEIEVPA
jgi:hypothetical protein